MAPSGKAVEVLQQRVALEVDLVNERLFGWTEIHLCKQKDFFPQSYFKAKKDGAQEEVNNWENKISLHCRQCKVEKVVVNGIETEHNVTDYLKKIVPRENVRDLQTYYACLAGDQIASKDGEMDIMVPRSEAQKRELVVRIHFSVEKPKGGVKFAACGRMIPDVAAWEKEGFSFTRGTNKKRYYSHVYTYTSLCGAETLGCGTGARSWFPCIDKLQARSRFTVELTIPAGLTAISIGECTGRKTSIDGKKKTVSFHYDKPVAPHNVGFCIGPFECLSTTGTEKVEIFYLPSAPRRTVEKSHAHLLRAIKEIVVFLQLQQRPFKNYRQIFIDHEFAHVDIAPFCTLSLVSDALLLPENEPTPDTPAGSGLLYDKDLHFIQAQGVGYNFFGCLVPAMSDEDVWLVSGLSLYLAYRYALKAWKLVKIQLPGMSTGITQLPNKTSTPGEQQDYFTRSCDPRELLLWPFKSLSRAKRNFDAVSKQHGLAGNVLQRPLRPPSKVRSAVDSFLWCARGFELDCLFSRRAFFMIHTVERLTNQGPGLDDEYSNSDTFVSILHQYLTYAIEDNSFRSELFKGFYEEKEAPQDAPFLPLINRTPESIHPTELGDINQRKLQENRTLVGISDYNFVLKLCTDGGLKSDEFNIYKGDNLADNWLSRCSFLELKGAVEYRNNNLSLLLAQGPSRTGGKPMSLPVRIKVVEEDDTWQHERNMASERSTIQLHALKQRQRGGRKSVATKVKMNKWDAPQTLETANLLLLFNSEDERIWHNELPVKYAILDPDIVWLRRIEWKQTDIMYLELLNDPALIMDDVLQQCFALEQMAIPSAKLEDDLARGSWRNDPSGGTPNSSAVPSSSQLGEGSAAKGTDQTIDLRCACAIASCIVDYRRPPRVRAEALMRLADWQHLHRPPKAAYEKEDPTLPVEKRRGTHPWVSLNMILVALQKQMFSTETGKLLPNDFGVPGELSVKRTAVRALKDMTAESGKPPDEVLDLILTLLRDNDNAVNNWSDALYVSDLNAAAGELVARYIIGTHREEHRDHSNIENIGGQQKTVQEVLGRFYDIIEHIRRYLHYDAVAASPNHIVTVGCLQALSNLESAGVIAPTTPFHAYAVYDCPVPAGNKEAAVAAKHDWGALVREEAFKCILATYLENREGEHIFKHPKQSERNKAWIDVFKWVIENVAKDPCPQLQWNVLKATLDLHARTVDEKHEELENHKSPSGLFWPLSNPKSDIPESCRQPTKDVANLLWSLFNENNDFDCRLRMAFSQLYWSIWGLETPMILNGLVSDSVDLGPFKGWAEGSHGEGYDDYGSSSPKKRKLISSGRGTPPPTSPSDRKKNPPIKLKIKKM